ncbi:MAG: hypothetical protein JWR90_376 [Marmoricola sp.]|jgi:hypothetical protein|nr:hypothetical protein [Marmoricola sp.]
MPDKLSKAEIRKDALQDGVTAASQAVGSVTTIITTAVGDIARAVGGFATEMFEIRDAARKASQDHITEMPPPEEPEDLGPDAPGPAGAVGGSGPEQH